MIKFTCINQPKDEPIVINGKTYYPNEEGLFTITYDE